MQSDISFPHSDAPVASVIVLAWRAAPDLLNCLASVARSVQRVPYEVLVVLNEPTPELNAAVERNVKGAFVLRTRVNVGFGGAHNLAAQHARGKFLVLLNDDATTEPNWLEELVSLAERRPRAAAVGASTLFPDGTLQEAGCVIWGDGSTIKVGRGLPAGSKRWDYERRVDFCSASSLLVRRSVWEELGGMDAVNFFPAYYEDTDLCLRINEAGHEVWYQPRAYIVHKESASTNATYRDFLFAEAREVFANRWKSVLEQRDDARPTEPDAIERAAWHAMGAPPRLLLIDDQVADPAIGSGYPRMAELYAQLTRAGYHLSIFTSLVDGLDRTSGLARLGVGVVGGSFEDDLERHLESTPIPYTGVIVSRPHNFERFEPVIRRAARRLPVIYDAEALFHRRIQRQAELAVNDEDAKAFRAQAAAMREVEARIAASADALVAISEEEAEFLREYAHAPVAVHGPLLEGLRPDARGYPERRDIGYVAGWAGGGSSPNVDALLWFVREVMPLVRARLPWARLLVTGLNPPEEARRVAGPSVTFVGNVDLDLFYASVRVIVVPMRYGAGVKNKTIEALQYGVPTVSTTVGAEGVPTDREDVLLISDEPRTFALRVSGLLENSRTWSLQRHRVIAQQERWRAEDPVWEQLLERTLRKSAVL